MKMKSSEKLSLETIIVQNPGNIISDMDGDTVMMSIGNGKYYNLGKTGGYLLGLLKTPISVNQLIIKLTQEFDVEKIQCENEISPFLELLLNENIISIERD